MLGARQFSLAFLFLEVLWIAVFAWSVRLLLTLPAANGHFACVLTVMGVTALGTFVGGFARNMAGGAKAGYLAALVLVIVLTIAKGKWWPF
jgi:hypothetical protein